MRDGALEDLIDERSIRAAIYRCARSVDRGDSECLADSFTPDAELQLGYYNGPVEGYLLRFRSIAENPDHASPQISRLHHRIANILCEIDANRDHARTESYFEVRRRMTFGEQAADEIIASRALDHWRRTPDGWKIARRTIVWDWSTKLAPSEDAWSDDPSYRRGGKQHDDPSHDFWAD